tara:strand:- start:1130 stop:1510 length:381 start_codon:yes stop_codon:yes gene_type:complete
MIYAHIDSNNKLLGWYDTNVHSVIPEPKIQVSETQWKISIEHNHNKVNNDGSTESFDFRNEEEKFSEDLENLRSKRNIKLAETDYLALSDNTLSDDMRTYRQDLRDLTNGLTTSAQVSAVIWPTKP